MGQTNHEVIRNVMSKMQILRISKEWNSKKGNSVTDAKDVDTIAKQKNITNIIQMKRKRKL